MIPNSDALQRGGASRSALSRGASGWAPARPERKIS